MGLPRKSVEGRERRSARGLLPPAATAGGMLSTGSVGVKGSPGGKKSAPRPPRCGVDSSSEGCKNSRRLPHDRESSSAPTPGFTHQETSPTRIGIFLVRSGDGVAMKSLGGTTRKGEPGATSTNQNTEAILVQPSPLHTRRLSDCVPRLRRPPDWTAPMPPSSGAWPTPCGRPPRPVEADPPAEQAPGPHPADAPGSEAVRRVAAPPRSRNRRRSATSRSASGGPSPRRAPFCGWRTIARTPSRAGSSTRSSRPSRPSRRSWGRLDEGQVATLYRRVKAGKRWCD